jgi:hypothetical protein
MRKPTRVRHTRDLDFYIIVLQLRENEIEQYAAFNDIEEWNPEVVARGFIAGPGIRFTLADEDDLPLVIGGFKEVSSGVWQSWMCGTDEAWKSHWREATKAARWLRDSLFKSGARRVFDTCLMKRTEAIRWITRSMGMSLEGVMKQLGKNGEDVGIFALTRDEWEKSYGQRIK